MWLVDAMLLCLSCSWYCDKTDKLWQFATPYTLHCESAMIFTQQPISVRLWTMCKGMKRHSVGLMRNTTVWAIVSFNLSNTIATCPKKHSWPGFKGGKNYIPLSYQSLQSQPVTSVCKPMYTEKAVSPLQLCCYMVHQLEKFALPDLVAIVYDKKGISGERAFRKKAHVYAYKNTQRHSHLKHAKRVTFTNIHTAWKSTVSVVLCFSLPLSC